MATALTLPVNGSSVNISSSQQQRQEEEMWSTMNHAAYAVLLITWLPSFVMCALMACLFYRVATFVESTKYILFMNLMGSDTCYVFVSGALMVVRMERQPLVGVLCCFLINLSTTLHINSSLTITAMALERFLAICQPLRYHQLAHRESGLQVVAGVCLLSLSVPTVRFLLCVASGVTFMTQPQAVCEMNVLDELVSFSKVAIVLRNSFTYAVFAFSVLAVLVSYAMTARAAKRASVGHSSFAKARNTIVLNGIQLGLCLLPVALPMLHKLVELLKLAPSGTFMMRVALYLMLHVFPRFMSPFMYGSRDEEIVKHVRKMFGVHSKRVLP